MDGFPVLTGILPHVREPEADVKGLKDHRSQRLAIPPCATFLRSVHVLGPHSLSIRVQHWQGLNLCSSFGTCTDICLPFLHRAVCSSTFQDKYQAATFETGWVIRTWCISAFLRVATCHSSLCTGKNSKSQWGCSRSSGVQLDHPNATRCNVFFSRSATPFIDWQCSSRCWALEPQLPDVVRRKSSNLRFFQFLGGIPAIMNQFWSKN